MKKVIRLTESDLIRLVKRIINEQGNVIEMESTRYESINTKDNKRYIISIADTRLGMGDAEVYGSDGTSTGYLLASGLMCDSSSLSHIPDGMWGFCDKNLSEKYGNFKNIKKENRNMRRF